jgi:hypothetical protein
MKDGSFHASGTPHFLKQRFQLPCTLSVVANRRRCEVFEKTGSAFVLSFQGLDAKLIHAVGNTYRYHIPQESLPTIPTILDSLDRFVRENIVASIKVETGSLSELCCMISEDIDDFSTNSTAASTECDDHYPTYEGSEKTNYAIDRVDVSWITQVILMCWKRWQIRKRQVFGLVRHLLIFAALVALSLGILAVPIRHVEYTIGLSPAFSNPHGGSSLYVGGGATLTNPYTSNQVMIDKLTAIEAAMANDETTVKIKSLTSVWNSSAMSKHLYRQNDTDALGAFVLFDAIPFHWDVNWPFYHEHLLRLHEEYHKAFGNWSLSAEATEYGNATGDSVEIIPGIEMVSKSCFNDRRREPQFFLQQVTLLDFFVTLAKAELDKNVQSELQRERQSRNGTTSILISASVMHNASFPHAV